VGILYGRPNEEGMDAVEKGEYVLGGCFVMPGQPDWHCTTCSYQWFDGDDPVRIRRDKILDDLDLLNGNSSDDTEKHAN
jgi:hypothetical protein